MSRQYNPTREVNYLGKANRMASMRPDSDEDYRERIPVVPPKYRATLPRVMHKAGELGLIIETAHGTHREHVARYKILEIYPAISEKINGRWEITEQARIVRHHKRQWITLQGAWDKLCDLEHEWYPPKEHMGDIFQTNNQTRI